MAKIQLFLQIIQVQIIFCFQLEDMQHNMKVERQQAIINPFL